MLPTVAGCIDIVVHCELDRHGVRRVAEILAVTGRVIDDQIEAETLFARQNGELAAAGTGPRKMEKFRAAGLDPMLLLGTGDAA